MKRFINPDAIKISPDRQRRQFDEGKLRELGDSIEKNGLLHAIILRMEGEDYQLVAGERRLRAMKDLIDLGTPFSYDGEPVHPGLIPYTLLSELSALAAEEAELEENIQRENLTWQERAAATARLANFRKAQASATGALPPTTADIALEVRGSSEGVNQETTRREMIVAKHLNNPAVKAAKSVDEAFKILKKEEAQAKHKALGETVGKTFVAESHKIFSADSLIWMKTCPAEAFDVILTDPPYGMGADEFKDGGGAASPDHHYKDDEETFSHILSVASTEFIRIAKEQAHLYWFCDLDQFHEIRATLTVAGWWVHRTPLIWHKPNGNRTPWPQHGPQRKYELILYAVKGKRNTLVMAPDVITCQSDPNLGLSAQKPVALYQELLSRSAFPGNTVLDPFCGTGPIFPAAHALKCKATGIELDPASYGIAVSRINKLKEQLELEGL